MVDLNHMTPAEFLGVGLVFLALLGAVSGAIALAIVRRWGPR